DREIDERLQSGTPAVDIPVPADPAAQHRPTVMGPAGEFAAPPEVTAAPAAPRPNDDSRPDLFPQGPPDLPAELRMAQRAQLSDLLAYIHDQLALIAEQAVEDRKGSSAEMRVDRVAWQRLLRLEMNLAGYLRRIADPHP